MSRWMPMCVLLGFWGTVLSAAEQAADEWYFVSMGDSVTAGFNSRWPGDINNGRYSWATGVSKRVDSHLNKLKKIIREEVKADNVAKSRATSHALEEQLEKIDFPKIDYLTLLIGANDVCDWDSDYLDKLSKFRANVKNTIDAVIATNSEVRILLAAIPNMYRLYEQGKDSCGQRWDFFDACPRLLSSERSDTERLAFRDRLIAANKTLQELSKAYQNNIKFIADVYDFEFTIEHVSRLDCFHPSIKGQNELARLTWNNGWYL